MNESPSTSNLTSRLRQMMTPEGMQSPIGAEAADEIERLRAVLDAIDPLHQPYNGQRGTRWCEAGDCDDSGWPCPTHLLIHPTTVDDAIETLGTVHK